MKISEQWLRLWVNPQRTLQEIGHQLTMAGLEMAGIEPAAKPFSGVVVGEILTCTQQPETKKLSLCEVKVSQETVLSIVCGANNIFKGAKVPVAMLGATLPTGLTIKQTTIQGMLSEGMLCSAVELGLAESSEGILLLGKEAPLGYSLWDYYQLNDEIIEIDLTPNRGDCQSVLGIARELGALTQTELTFPAFETLEPTIDDTFHIKVLAPDACPSYIGRVIRGVDPKAKTPLWMQERLRRAGLRPISPVVDVTNYVLLELGQPMHAFDLDRLTHQVTVRFAEEGESLTLLDGKTVNCLPETLLIADDKGPLALAGIMGGEASSVTEETVDLFLESAFFPPSVLQGMARKYGLQTDSSYRYERGVDFNGQQRAMSRATELLLSICGGRAGPMTQVIDEAALPKREPILLRTQRITRILGMTIPHEAIVDALKRLEMSCTEEVEGYLVVPPSHRFDITKEIDLIEEVARIWGFERITADKTGTKLSFYPVSETLLDKETLTSILVAKGYQEVITYSFIDPKKQSAFEPSNKPLTLLNPISHEMSVMRTSLCVGLLETLKHNQHRQIEGLKIFETGLKFVFNQAGELEQIPMLCLLLNGKKAPEQWGEASKSFDFYDLKGEIESLLALTGQADAFEFVTGEVEGLHPGQTALLRKGTEIVGYLGVLHPKQSQVFGLKGQTLLFECPLVALREISLPKYQSLSKYPAIRRDLALVVDNTVQAQSIQALIRTECGDLLHNCQIFDVYTGEGVEKGKKSIALGLTLQHQSRTLVDSEVNTLMEKVFGELRNKLSATLRE